MPSLDVDAESRALQLPQRAAERSPPGSGCLSRTSSPSDCSKSEETAFLLFFFLSIIYSYILKMLTNSALPNPAPGLRSHEP